MRPRSVEQAGFEVAGIAVQTSNALEADPATANIPGLWRRFFEERVADRIAHRASPDQLFGVYTRYESDANGPYTLLVGTEVRDRKAVPPGLIVLTVPAARYLVFEAVGQMPSAVIETWAAIWSYFSRGTEARRAYTADFELYDSRTPDWVEIFVAVK